MSWVFSMLQTEVASQGLAHPRRRLTIKGIEHDGHVVTDDGIEQFCFGAKLGVKSSRGQVGCRRQCIQSGTRKACLLGKSSTGLNQAFSTR